MLLDQIENYHELTANEKKVLSYILDHYREVPFMNINELAKNNFISKTVVINLCQKIGFAGFKELKYYISSSIKQEEHEKHEYVGYRSKIEDSLEKTFSLISDENLIQCAEIMAESNNIFIMARGTSLAAGYYIQHLLFSIDHHCIFINDYNLAEAYVNLVREGDCIIFISLSGVTQKVVDTARNFQLKGCKLITLTGFHNNTLAAMSPYNLYIYTEEVPKKYGKNDAYSRLGFFLIIELLVNQFKEIKAKGNKE